MGYFEGLVDARFKKVEDGRVMFYPNGIFSRGYVLTEEKNKEIKMFMNKYYKRSFPLIFISIFLSGMIFDTAFYAMVLAPILGVHYKLKIKSLIGSEVIYTREKLKARERIRNMATSMGKRTCITLFLGNVLLTGMSVYVYVLLDKILLAGVGVVFFAACFVQSVVMVYYSYITNSEALS